VFIAHVFLLYSGDPTVSADPSDPEATEPGLGSGLP